MVRISLVAALARRAECVNNRLKKDIAHKARVETIAAAAASKKWHEQAPVQITARADGLSELGSTLQKLEAMQAKEDGKIEAIFVYVSLIRDCVDRCAVRQGEEIHSHMTKHGHPTDRLIGNLLIELYGKSGSVEEALRVFNSLKDKTATSYALMVSAFAQNGEPGRAIELFRKMAIVPDAGVLVAAIRACSSLRLLEEGRRIHKQVIGSGFARDWKIQPALLAMYIACGDLETARLVFDAMKGKTKGSEAWNSLICGYLASGLREQGFKLFRQMLAEPPSKGSPPPLPEKKTMVAILDACASSRDLEEARAMQRRIGAACSLDPEVASAAMRMYRSCGSAADEKAVHRCFLERRGEGTDAFHTVFGEAVDSTPTDGFD